MKKKLLYIFVFVYVGLFAPDAFAQLPSQHAVGLRFGSSSGITYRYTLAEDRAVEGILSLQSNSKTSRFRLGGLYQYHKPLSGDFSWYYGFGGSLGSIKYKSVSVQTQNEQGQTIPTRTDPTSELILSVDGVVGVEYNIPSAPLAISLDVKPYFDFLQESSIRIFDPIGFSIRYKF